MNRLESSYGRVLATVAASTLVAMLGYAGPLGNAVTLNAALRAGPAGATWILASMSVGLTGALDLAGAWRVFYLFLAAAGAALWFSARRIPTRPPHNPDRAQSVLGFVLLTAALSAAVAALVEVRAREARLAIALAVAALVLTAALVASQRYGSARLVDPALFRRRRFLSATVAGLGTGIGIISAMSYSGTFAVHGLGLSTLQAGCLLTLWAGTSAVAALGFSRLAGVLSGRAHLIGGLVGVALGLLLMSGLSDGASPARLIPGFVVAGIASGLLNTGLAREAISSVPAGDAAMGSGVNNTARYVGSALGITIAGVLAAGAPDAIAGWNRIALAAAAASLVCAAGAGLLTLRTGAPATGRGTPTVPSPASPRPRRG